MTVGLAAGAIGDVDPAYPGYNLSKLKSARRNFEENLELVERVGRAVGDALATACLEAREKTVDRLRLTCGFAEPVIKDAVLADGTQLARAPLIGTVTLGGSELGGGAPFIEEGNPDSSLPPLDPQWPKEPPRALERHLRELLRYHPHTLPLRVVRVGDTCLLGLPGEPTTWLTHEFAALARKHGAAQVLVAGVCGDYAGYLTSRAEYEQQHYEGSSTLWGRHTHAWLHEKLEALLAVGASTPQPTESAVFTVRAGVPTRLEFPRPPSEALSIPWKRSPWFDKPRWENGRLRLSGGWFAWAPQEQRELGWGAWLQVEDADSGEVLVHQGRPLNDLNHRFVLRFFAEEKQVDWRWELNLEGAQHLAGRRVRVRTVGPRGTRVEPPAGAGWPVRSITQP